MCYVQLKSIAIRVRVVLLNSICAQPTNDHIVNIFYDQLEVWGDITHIVATQK